MIGSDCLNDLLEQSVAEFGPIGKALLGIKVKHLHRSAGADEFAGEIGGDGGFAHTPFLLDQSNDGHRAGLFLYSISERWFLGFLKFEAAVLGYKKADREGLSFRDDS